jgi:hypothetical protein
VKQFWLLVVVFVSFDSLWSQEVKHAPTVEQCRADQKFWFSKISDDAKAEEAEGLREPVAASISFQQLNFCSLEMHDCARIDPEFKKEYYQTSGDAVGAANNRLVHFLYRHNLLNQFLAEDAEGKR